MVSSLSQVTSHRRSIQCSGAINIQAVQLSITVNIKVARHVGVTSQEVISSLSQVTSHRCSIQGSGAINIQAVQLSGAINVEISAQVSISVQENCWCCCNDLRQSVHENMFRVHIEFVSRCQLNIVIRVNIYII